MKTETITTTSGEVCEVFILNNGARVFGKGGFLIPFEEVSGGISYETMKVANDRAKNIKGSDIKL